MPTYYAVVRLTFDTFNRKLAHQFLLGDLGKRTRQFWFSCAFLYFELAARTEQTDK